MSINLVDEQIRLYAKQLKSPTFANYNQVLRQTDHSLGLSGLLLKLMKAKCEARQDSQFQRWLKVAGFPFSCWTELFENSAMVDCLTFRSHVLDMNACLRTPSWIKSRLPPSAHKLFARSITVIPSCVFGNLLLRRIVDFDTFPSISSVWSFRPEIMVWVKVQIYKPVRFRCSKYFQLLFRKPLRRKREPWYPQPNRYKNLHNHCGCGSAKH